MAIALVAEVLGQGDSGGDTTAAIDTTGASLLVIGVVYNSGATVPTISDSKGNTWNALTGSTDSPTTARLYYAVNPTVGSNHTFSALGTNSFAALHALAFSGVDTASPFDQQNGNATGAANVTSLPTGSVTPTEDNELLVTVLGAGGVGLPDNPAISGGFTLVDSAGNISGQSFGIATAYLVQTTAAASNPEWSWTTADDAMAARIATFKEADAGGAELTVAALSGIEFGDINGSPHAAGAGLHLIEVGALG